MSQFLRSAAAQQFPPEFDFTPESRDGIVSESHDGIVSESHDGIVSESRDGIVSESHDVRKRAESHGWGVIVAKARLDAFSQDQLVREIRNLRDEGCIRVAIEMRGNRFMSFQAIRYLVDLGAELAGLGGRLALVAPIEKTKRHFEIYGSLKTISIYRSTDELGEGVAHKEAPARLREL